MAGGQDSQPGTGANLSSVAAAAAALVGGVGALTLTGVLGRVQRNNGTAFAVAVACVLMGTAVWVGGAMISEKARKLHLRKRHVASRQAVQVIGIALLVAGLILGFWVAIGTAGDTEQSAVALTLNGDGTAVSATAKVGNLRSDGRLNVYVDGLTVNDMGHYVQWNLYKAFVGPSGDGEAVDQAQVAIPAGQFDAIGLRAFTAKHPRGCGDYPVQRDGTPGTGCVILQLPARPAYPELSATWDGSGHAADAVRLTMQTQSIPPRMKGGNVLLLRVTAVRGRRTLTLYRAMIPAPEGATKRDIRIPLPARLSVVCADAQFVRADRAFPAATCPLGSHPVGASVELRVPA